MMAPSSPEPVRLRAVRNSTEKGLTVAISIYDQFVPVFSHMLQALDKVLSKAEADAAARKIGYVEPRPGTDCYYPLHTHDMTGKIHVEATAPAVFTLGQFFAIWGEPLEPTNMAGYTDLPVVIYIVDVMEDGRTRTASRYEGDFHAIELKSRRGIVVQIGEKIAEIPTYNWYTP